MGVQIATRPTWAFQEVPQKAVPSGGSNLARLGELGGKFLLLFPINRGRREEQKRSLKISKKNCFCEENPSRGAFVTLPRRFRG